MYMYVCYAESVGSREMFFDKSNTKNALFQSNEKIYLHTRLTYAYHAIKNNFHHSIFFQIFFQKKKKNTVYNSCSCFLRDQENIFECETHICFID